MNILIYFIIFISKVMENALATLRLIVVANNKKVLGAFLQFAVAVIWITVTGLVVIDITTDPLKVIFFALGSFVGSYFGSFIEEKIAMGNILLISIVNKNIGPKIVHNLTKNNYGITVLEGNGKDDNKNILMIMIPRRKRNAVVKIIKQIDSKAVIIAERIASINGGYNYH